MSALRPPTRLETARLRLRPLVLADAPAVLRWASSEVGTRFMEFARHRSIVEAEAFAARCERCWAEGSAFPWAIEEREAEREPLRVIGCIELRIALPKADFGYILADDVWGRGLATEAASAVVDWARAEPAIHRVWATCHPENRASARVLEKAGLTFEARLGNWIGRPNLAEAAGDSLSFAWVRSPPRPEA